MIHPKYIPIVTNMLDPWEKPNPLKNSKYDLLSSWPLADYGLGRGGLNSFPAPYPIAFGELDKIVFL
jgi:hypothetical protein